MIYDDRLWDDKDPLYAPGLSWSKPTNARWKAPKRYVKAGYGVRGVPLPGHQGDGRDAERASLCRDHTRAMVRWWRAQEAPQAKPGTWLELILRYEQDAYSPIAGVKANTKAGYLEQTAKLKAALGHMKVGELTYEHAMGMKLAMEAKGRSVSYIKRLFTQLRMVTKYGTTVRLAGSSDAAMALSGIKLTTPPARSVFPTRDQVMTVVAEADRRGMLSFSCAYLLCYELSLRAVDIRGQWLPATGESGIIHNGKRWQDGMTWDMLAPDLSSFTKVISKTAKSLPEAYTFDLTLLPDIQRRLRDLRPDMPVGPVITTRQGLPYTTTGWSQAFRRIRDSLGLPKELYAMDNRAGGMTEARAVVSDPMLLRDAAQHKHINTTSGYVRGRSDGANQVIELRKART